MSRKLVAIQFEHNASASRAAIFCVAISDGKTSMDAPAKLTQTLSDARHKVVKSSDCNQNEGNGVTERSSGKPALMLNLGQVKWLASDEVEADGGYYEASLSIRKHLPPEKGIGCLACCERRLELDCLNHLEPVQVSENPTMAQFAFKPRWKEELVCSCSLGSFVLDMPMGVVSVYLPTKDHWGEVAPAWALELWDALYQQLQEWCEKQNIPLHLDATGYAGVHPENF